MALVFKIKFKGTLRRWVVSEDCNSATFDLTFTQLENKIRALFHLTQTTPLVLTYVDKDGDAITLGDDDDLLDVCSIQQLNPFHLDVHEKLCVQASVSKSFISSTANANTESALRTFSSIPRFGKTQQGVRRHLQVLGPKHRADNVHNVFHLAVEGDECGIAPIRGGSRYESREIPNYDHCLSLDLTEITEDFRKLYYPETKCSTRVFDFAKEESRPCLPPFLRHFYTPECPFSGQELECCSLNVQRKDFDARFVDDVTVLDGAELEPGTDFTKTWRMQNSGTLPWPQSTQLACVGGSALAWMEVVDLELPGGGLPCGQLIDISVEMKAPICVGHYVSHWRLVLPSRESFGNTVWVEIYVQPQPKQLHMEVNQCEEAGNPVFEEAPSSSHSLVDSGNDSAVLPDDKERPLVLECETDSEQEGGSLMGKPAKSNLSRCVQIEDHDMQQEILQSMDIKNQQSNLLGLNENDANMESTSTDSLVDASWKDKAIFLKEMEQDGNFNTDFMVVEPMGLKNQQPNLFCLNGNNTHIESKSTDLPEDAGWEDKGTFLKDLGFSDQITNARLLCKYNGSIKLVVKDLVRLENESMWKTS